MFIKVRCVFKIKRNVIKSLIRYKRIKQSFEALKIGSISTNYSTLLSETIELENSDKK